MSKSYDPSALDPLKITVEQYLNSVCYEENPDYIPSDFALEFVNFIKLVNGGEGEENLTPVVHYKMLDNIQKNDKDTINMCHRGMAKSTVLGTYLILYLAVYGELPGFGKIPYALYVSDAVENGVKKMRLDLQFRWENSAFLQEYVPVAKFTDIRWEFHNIEGTRTVISGHGAKTGVRGTRELGTRPRLAILDDLISDDDARSETVIASVEDTVYKAIDYALHPKWRKIIWSGTPFNAKDPLYKAVESGAWHVNVYPICEEFPCSREEFRGSWVDRFSYDYVLKQYTKARLSGKLNTFNQELMLRIMSEEDRLVEDTDIGWYRRSTILLNRNAYNFYITTDFATSAKASNDYSVISVWALNWQGYWFWVDGVCKKQTMDKNINDLFRLVAKWRPMSVGVEVSGQQGGFVSWIQTEMGDRNCYFNMASENNEKKPGIRPVTDKMARFNIMLPLFKANKMFFPIELKESPEMLECMNELTLIAQGGFKAKHDDFIDTISMLGSMPTTRPSQDLTMEKNEDGIWEAENEEDNTTRIESYVV